MARTALTVHALDERNTFATAFATLEQAVDATNGSCFEMSERDDKYMLLLHNSASANKSVTVKSGNGLQGTEDISVSLAGGSYTFITLESGRFKNVSGEDKGKVVITGPADIKAAVFKLP